MENIPIQPTPPTPQEPPAMQPQPSDDFQPNIYPIMYWALAYAAIGGILLFLIYVLSQFITIVWAPVFLVGLAWGAFRNYKKQKADWLKYKGMPTSPQSAVQEFKEAARDIFQASRTMIAEQAAEDTTRLQAEEQAAQAQFEAEQGYAPQNPEEPAYPEATEEIAPASEPENPPVDTALPLTPPTPPTPPSNNNLPPAPPFPTNQV